MSRGTATQLTGAGLLSIGELAAHSAISAASLRRLVKSQQLPAVRIGRAVRIRLLDWEAFLREHRVSGSDAPEPVLSANGEPLKVREKPRCRTASGAELAPRMS